ncbi:organomercurial lyase MerB [Nocardia wallacei]|uniref:organomercurial lyase MerB n=1 Tax=Nocardia wallacei TaxID=480035 RepID=UPI002458F1D0|nr:organomercurial lyase MerB [Nocardia wallacei]
MATTTAGRMTIGELSRRSGVSVKALREYTDLGLIYTLGRSPSGYRLYTTDALWCVGFIGELRGLGLTIAEIRHLVAAFDDPGQSVGSRLAELLQRSRHRLRRRISEYQQILGRIDEFESAHRVHLVADDVCWAGNPRGNPPTALDSPTGGRPEAGCRKHLHRKEATGMTASKFTDTIIGKLFDPAGTTRTTLMGTAMRLLAHGEPIAVDQLATAAGVEVADIESAPAAADIEYDDKHRIRGWGLTLNPTPHRFTVDNHLLYTWCAADTLLFPAILGRPARIESPCPATGTTIRLTVDPAVGVNGLDPATAVVSLPGPDELDMAQVRATTCNPGRYFASAQAGADWQAQHPTGVLLPVAAAYNQLRALSDRVRTGTGTPPCC